MIAMGRRIKKRGKQQPARQNKGLNLTTELNNGWRKLLLVLLLFLLVLGGSPAPLSAGSINLFPVGNNDTVAMPESVITGGSVTASQISPDLPAAELGVPSNCPPAAREIDKEQKVRVEKLLAQLPLYFIQNQGQLDKQVLFYTQGQNQALYFTSRGLTVSFSQSQDSTDKNNLSKLEREMKSGQPSSSPQRWAVKLDFIGANPSVQPCAETPVPTKVSYFKGSPQDWQTGIAGYSRLVYPDLWPGIDLIFKGDAGSLKYEFVVSPGADPAQIRLAWRGASSVSIDEQGQMEIKSPLGSFTDGTPLVWQEGGGERNAVAASYFLEASRKDNVLWGFNLGSYDPARELIIDPAILDYCGYIGGTNRDDGYSIAVDSSGRAYVTGVTASTVATGFPVSGGPDSSYNGGAYDVFVARVAADGLSLDYCGYIGGTDVDAGNGIAVDSSGRAYVTGHTSSSGQGFPVCGGLGSGHVGAFVARVAADGLSLEYCGYIGGSDVEVGNGIAVDSSGRAYVTGYTNSTEAQGFPVSGGPDSSHNGGEDVFVACVAADGDSLEYCGYIGGSNNERGTGIAVDSSGRAYVTGYTASTEATFPVGGGPDSSYNGGSYDAFVARVAANGSSLEYCSYIGGSKNDQGAGIAVDSGGRAYVTGYTNSTKGQGFPANGGADSSHNGREDVFVARVAGDGLSLEYCSYIGGSQDERGNGIAVDSSGRAYVTGYTNSTKSQGFPASGGPNSSLEGGRDAFVARVAGDGHSLDYCGYIGGSKPDMGYGIAVDGEGIAYVTGYTESAQNKWFPVSGGPDIIHNGVEDVFVARVLPRGDQNYILGFTLPEQTGPASIDNVAQTVYMEVVCGTNPASLAPTITVSVGASINPASGTARDFSAPVSYTVTAKDGTPRDWTVNVAVAVGVEHDILGFILPEQTGSASIDNVAHTVYMEVASGTNLTSLTPTITVSAGASINPAGGAARDFTGPVSYTVTAENGNSQDWTVNVTAAASSANDILNFTLPEQTGPATINNVVHSVNIEVVNGTNLTNLPPTITVSAGASINPAGGAARDFSAPVSYTVTAENGNSQDWTVNVTAASSIANDILNFTLPEQTGPAIINNVAHSVNIEVVNETNLTSLTPTITVSAGASINPASGAARDFSAPVSYTVTAENGNSQDWTVNVTAASSTANDILNFTLPEQTDPATIDNVAHTVYMEVLSGSNLASLIPTITVSAGASINPASGTARDFSAPVTYTVTAENGDPQDWMVNVTVASSIANDILNFTLPEQTGPAIINNVAHSVNIEVANGTNLTGLTPTITVSAGANINPASGTARDFSDPVSYTVTAENGDPRDWTVNVTVAGPSRPHSGGGDDSNPPADTGLLITRIGGTIKQDDVSIIFPNGAVENDIRVIIKQISDNSGLNTPASAQLLSRIMDIAKDKSGNFLKTLTITLSFDKSRINPDEYDIAVYWYDENAGKWIVLENMVLDLEGGRVSGDINHFTKFAVLATPKPASCQPPMIFPDIAGHWAKDSIIKLINAGVVSGYPDGTFQPNKAVSRAEFTVMLIKAMNLEKRAGNTFTDTASHWAKESITAAAVHGMVSGYDAAHFGPDDLITREQAAALISRAVKLEAVIEDPRFTDSNQISLWAKADVATAFQNEFINGYPDGSFRPRENTSRAEAAYMIGKIR